MAAATKSFIKKSLKAVFPSNSMRSDSEGRLGENCNDKFSVSYGCNKRKSELVQDGPTEKRRKMDRSAKLECGDLLNTLINHPDGWFFKTPIDPVALEIPDYFRIISHPMDLGTIKSKLARDRYLTAEKFASDIKLTFSNAMLYYPADNSAHIIAKQLNCIFTRRWKMLEAKWKHHTSRAQQVMISVESEKNVQDLTNSCYKKSHGIKNPESFKKPPRMTSSGSCNMNVKGRTPPVDDECPIKKALRAAMLTSRFAEIISKSNNEKTDLTQMQQERERLYMLQKREEYAKIEKQIREEQSKKKAELKIERDKQREAARTALDKMEKIIDFDENLRSISELEKLSRCSQFDNLHPYLERIGLRLKSCF